MPTQTYWINRANQRMDQYILDSERVADEITKAYYKASKRIESQMIKTIQGLSALSDSRTAIKALIQDPDAKALKSLRRAVSALPEGQEKQEALTLLSSPAYQFRLRRLQATIDNARRECEKLYKVELKDTTRRLRQCYNSAFTHTIYDIDKGFNTLHTFSMFPASRVNTLLRSRWSGKNYSDRIWNSTNKLADTLKEQLLVSFMTGSGVTEAAAAIREEFQTSAHAARRLVRTETNFIANQSELDAYKRLGIEEYRYIATLDTRTSDICQSLDNQVFKIDDAKAGVNLPPMHPNCRSTTIMHDAEEPLKERIAKDENGKSIYVPGNMSYSQWLQKYHPELSPDVQQFRSVIKSDAVFTTFRNKMKIDSREITTSVNHLHVSENVKLKPKALSRIDNRISEALKLLKIENAENLPQIIIVNQNEMQTNAVASYVPAKNVMYVVESLSSKDLKRLQALFTCPENSISTMVHEFYHWIDAQKYRAAGGTFNNAEEVNKYFENLNKDSLKRLDKALGKGYNYSNISSYAAEEYNLGNFAEVYTEYRTKKVLKG